MKHVFMAEWDILNGERKKNLSHSQIPDKKVAAKLKKKPDEKRKKKTPTPTATNKYK